MKAIRAPGVAYTLLISLVLLIPVASLLEAIPRFRQALNLTVLHDYEVSPSPLMGEGWDGGENVACHDNSHPPPCARGGRSRFQAHYAWMARRRAEEGPLWGSDPGEAHEIGIGTTRP